MGDSYGTSEDVLEDIAFLARSANRVRILDILTAEPYTRGEVAEITGIARTTVDRIINEFEERDWARRTTDGGYTATLAGDRIVIEFKQFTESMEVIGKLGDRVAWLPVDEVPLDLHHFSDVTVRRPDPANPTGAASRLTDLLQGASEFHCLVGVAPPLGFETSMRDGVVNRDLITEHVITSEELRYLREHPKRLPRWRDYLNAGANVYLYDGTIPCNLFVFDKTVIIGNNQSEIGDQLIWIETENETIRSWAFELIDRYREEAIRLDAEAFLEDSTTAWDNDRC